MRAIKTAWQTENWLRIDGGVFMVQQKWELMYDTDRDSGYEYGSVAVTTAPFPTDEWRVVPLEEMVSDDDLREMMESVEE